MKQTTREWVKKAEDDFVGASALRRLRKSRPNDLIGFHCQQCVEKYMKARLNEEGIGFAKTHHLLALLALLVKVEPLWLTMERSFKLLQQFAVTVRYPGTRTSAAEARDAFSVCRQFRSLARQSLGLRE